MAILVVAAIIGRGNGGIRRSPSFLAHPSPVGHGQRSHFGKCPGRLPVSRARPAR